MNKMVLLCFIQFTTVSMFGPSQFLSSNKCIKAPWFCFNIQNEIYVDFVRRHRKNRSFHFLFFPKSCKYEILAKDLPLLNGKLNSISMEKLSNSRNIRFVTYHKMKFSCKLFSSVPHRNCGCWPILPLLNVKQKLSPSTIEISTSVRGKHYKSNEK